MFLQMPWLSPTPVAWAPIAANDNIRHEGETVRRMDDEDVLDDPDGWPIETGVSRAPIRRHPQHDRVDPLPSGNI